MNFLEAIPQYLLKTLPSRKHLIKLIYDLGKEGLLENHNGYLPGLWVSITSAGIFHFRKNLQPMIEKSRESKKNKRNNRLNRRR